MKVKKYQASTIADAMKLVGKDIGPDALILSTRKVHGKNQDSSGYSEYFEITAIPGQNSKNEKIEGWSPSDPNLEYLKSLRSELMSIREMMFVLSRSRSLMDGFRVTPRAMNIYGKLIRSGIADAYAKRFLEKGGVFNDGGQFSAREVRLRVLKEMLKVIEITDPFETSDQVIAAFIGPTGVGKTTTIAKLAANLYLKRKKKVGFISIDNYRIAALDQLKTYASIMGIPCFPAFNNNELEYALQCMKEKDVILIDTAGQSHYDLERINEMEKLIGGNYSIKSHLLLNTSTNEVEMERIVSNFNQLNIKSYIFTKTDETKQRGVIINQLIKKKIPISYVTTGQRVPEDIVQASKVDILKLLF